jgi:hypothetical protein
MAERMYTRHPKRKDKALVEQAICRLWLRMSDPETEAPEVERVHALWCEVADWRKENGRFAPSLANWLSDEGWRKEPEIQMDVGDDYVGKLMKAWDARDAERASRSKPA